MVVCCPGHYERDAMYMRFVDLTAVNLLIKAWSLVLSSLDHGLLLSSPTSSFLALVLFPNNGQVVYAISTLRNTIPMPKFDARRLYAINSLINATETVISHCRG
jgi:hypothetical protein